MLHTLSPHKTAHSSVSIFFICSKGAAQSPMSSPKTNTVCFTLTDFFDDDDDENLALVANLVKHVQNTCDPVLLEVMKQAADAVKGMQPHKIGKFFRGLWNKLKHLGTFAIALLVKLANDIGAAMKGLFSYVWDAIKSFFSWLADSCKSLWTSFLDWVKSTCKRIIAAIEN